MKYAQSCPKCGYSSGELLQECPECGTLFKTFFQWRKVFSGVKAIFVVLIVGVFATGYYNQYQSTKAEEERAKDVFNRLMVITYWAVADNIGRIPTIVKNTRTDRISSVKLSDKIITATLPDPMFVRHGRHIDVIALSNIVKKTNSCNAMLDLLSNPRLSQTAREVNTKNLKSELRKLYDVMVQFQKRHEAVGKDIEKGLTPEDIRELNEVGIEIITPHSKKSFKDLLKEEAPQSPSKEYQGN